MIQRLVLLGVLVISGTAFAAPPASSSTAEAPPMPTVSGTLEKIIDGTIVLKVEIKEEQRAQLVRMRQVANGYPRAPGGVGLVKGELYIRYALAPGKELEPVMERMLGQKLTLQLDRALLVQKVLSAP